jgi:biotin transport system substrate-specific component
LSAGAGSPPPRVLADVFARTRFHDGALVLGAALFTAWLAQVSIAVPGSLVPITGQTLAVVITAAALSLIPISGGTGVYTGVRGVLATTPNGDRTFTQVLTLLKAKP